MTKNKDPIIDNSQLKKDFDGIRRSVRPFCLGLFRFLHHTLAFVLWIAIVVLVVLMLWPESSLGLMPILATGSLAFLLAVLERYVTPYRNLLDNEDD